MKKFISFCKLHCGAIAYVLFIAVILFVGVITSHVAESIGAVFLIAVCKMVSGRSKPQGPSCIPMREDCEKDCPYVRQHEADKYLKTNLRGEFDVLCEVDGQKVRLPFSQRHLGKPIGIFPSAGPEYLELDELMGELKKAGCI